MSMSLSSPLSGLAGEVIGWERRGVDAVDILCYIVLVSGSCTYSTVD